MRLTVEEDRETIKRYAHIRPGRAFGGSLCSAKCPGSTRTCTLTRNHRGPHVAHSLFKKVVAVWDADSAARRSGDAAMAVVPRVRGGVWTGGLGEPLTALWSRVASVAPSVGDLALLILLVGFLVFAVRWLLLIF